MADFQYWMKFAHFGDAHLGGWREPVMREYGMQAFFEGIDEAVHRGVDFILISGDLFNTAFPSIDTLKAIVMKLKELSEMEIPVYIIPGSHDFSASGRTMLDVLQEAGLVWNVFRGEVRDGKLHLTFTVDKRTGVKITGIPGKRGMLERSYYEDLSHNNLEQEEGFKIFMFHTALTELKPDELEKMESAPMTLLPKGFDYYAGGHVHDVIDRQMPGYGRIIYPGPTFPNNFRELERLQGGSFVYYEDGAVEHVNIKVVRVVCILANCDQMLPSDAQIHIQEVIEATDVRNAVCLMRITGTLKATSINEIDLIQVTHNLYDKGAAFVLRNTSGLMLEEFEDVQIPEMDVCDLEEMVITEQLPNSRVDGMDDKTQKKLIRALMTVLGSMKQEDEKRVDYEERLRQDLMRILK